MNKKIIFFLSLLFMFSFSTGIFAQIMSSDQVSLSSETLSFGRALFSGIKGELLTVLTALSLTASVYLLPLCVALMTGKVFALGFSAAYLLAAHPQGISILCTVLLPRCLIRLPIYMALLLTAFALARARRRKKHAGTLWQTFVLCCAALLLTALLEVCLLQLAV